MSIPSKIPSANSLVKKPSPYGWGWLIFFSFLTYYDRQNPLSNPSFSYLWSMLILLFLILYFWLRRKFIKKWEYSTWKPGLVAGLSIYLVAGIVLGIISYFDTKSTYSTIASVNARYKDKLEFFRQEEVNYE